MRPDSNRLNYAIRLGDDQLILGQRLGEWCGHAPSLEEDLALANIALDHSGQARAIFNHAAGIEGRGRDEDAIALLRGEREYTNVLLVEQPNGNFADTIMREFVFSSFMVPFWKQLAETDDEMLSGIALKAGKEATYHWRHSAEWVIRLGDGTAESSQRAATALETLWPYSGELFEADDVVEEAVANGYGVDPACLRPAFESMIEQVLSDARLLLPSVAHMQSGGRSGRHSEHLGHILSELQYMQRTYPGLEW